MKEGVEKLIEKLEILSSVCSKNKKFKTRAEERIKTLEDQMESLVTKDVLVEDLEKIEGRINGFITE